MKTTRRTVLRAGAAGVAGLILPSNLFAKAAPVPKRGGTITTSMDLEPVSLHPLHANAPGVDRYVLNQMFDALLRIEPDGSLSPGLATKWSYSEDGRAITLELRENVTFHDGTPFDAEAAKKNLDYATDPNVTATHAKDLAEIDNVEVIGPHQIRLNLSNPSGAILAALGTEPAMMVSPKAMHEMGEEVQRNPVGTGPFRFVRWASGEYIETVRNEDYWETAEDGGRLPYLDGLTMRFISNNSTKIVEMQGGNLQLADAITPRDAQQLETDDRVKLLNPPGGIQSWLNFNNQDGPFSNIHIRRAAIAAIDRNALLQAISLGVGATPPVMFAPTEWAYSEEPAPHPYDPDVARKEIEASGMGPRVKATLSVIQRDPDVQIAQILQSMLGQVGFDLEVRVLERQAWVQNVIDKKFEVGMGRWAIPYPDPDQICGSVLGRGVLNWANIQNDELTQLVIEAAQKVDQEERKQLYHQIQEILIDQANYAFLIMRGVKHLASPELHGVRFESNGPWILSGSYLA